MKCPKCRREHGTPEAMATHECELNQEIDERYHDKSDEMFEFFRYVKRVGASLGMETDPEDSTDIHGIRIHPHGRPGSELN